MAENENKSDGISPLSVSNPSKPSPQDTPSCHSPREGTRYYALSKTSSDNHISPHLASPVGEGQLLLLLISH